MGSASGSNSDALNFWAADREIVLSRVIPAPRELVFKVWTDPQHLPKWFGPEGFHIQTLEIAVQVGGKWRFVLIGPDGTRWDSRMVFLKIAAPRLLEMDHGSDIDDDPNRFRVTVTFDEQSNGKTVVTMRQLHPTEAQRNGGISFGAVEFGYQTLDKLALHVGQLEDQT